MTAQKKIQRKLVEDWGKGVFSSSPPQALGFFKSFKPFHSIIHYYVDLSCFLIPSPRAQGWWSLNRRKSTVGFSEVEAKYGDSGERYRFIQDSFKEVQKKKKTICADRFGLKDLFVPLLKKMEILGYIQAGTFCGSEVTTQSLKKCWKEMTGLDPSPVLPEYRDFVRALLEVPVLEEDLLRAYQECLETLAGLLTEEISCEDAEKRFHQLLVGTISKDLPHSYWMDWALGRPAAEPVPFWSRRVETWPWTREEIGITRVPTAVMALMPLRAGRGELDWTEEIVRIYRFQRRSFKFAQTIPETVGGKLENYGSVFVTSADPSEPRLKQRRQLEEVAQQIRDFGKRELDGPVRLGVGRVVVPGQPLADSYRQAVLALHLDRDSEKDIVMFAGKTEAPESGGFLQLRRIQAEFEKAFVTASTAETEALKGRFLKEVLSLSFQSPYEIRLHLLYLFDRLADKVEKGMDIGKKEMEQIRERVIRALEEAIALGEMVMVFQDSVDELRQFMAQPSLLKETSTVEKTRNYLDQHFREPLRTDRLSKIAGVSPSTLSRRFKKLAGLSMEAYLQNLRIKEAKNLLKTTLYSVSRIRGECGFNSDSYFINLFKKKTGLSPEKYRKKP